MRAAASRILPGQHCENRPRNPRSDNSAPHYAWLDPVFKKPAWRNLPSDINTNLKLCPFISKRAAHSGAPLYDTPNYMYFTISITTTHTLYLDTLISTCKLFNSSFMMHNPLHSVSFFFLLLKYILIDYKATVRIYLRLGLKPQTGVGGGHIFFECVWCGEVGG